MTYLRLVTRSLSHYWRLHAAVLLGVAAATAVLSGALLVGDSVRGSLRALTLDRLGTIDRVMAQDRFFRIELADELSAQDEFRTAYPQVAPAILFPQATVEHRTGERVARSSSVLVLACDERFWAFDARGVQPRQMPGEREIVLNDVLARELGVGVGDTVTLRLPQSNQVPADSPLASKNDRIRGLPGLKVVDVIPAEGLGRFSLRASQSVPANVFLSIGTLQDALDQAGKVNAIFVGGEAARGRAPGLDPATLLKPSLADWGITVKQVRHGYREGGQEVVSIEYFSIATDRMIFSAEMSRVISGVVEPLGGQPVLTYLANAIERVVPASDAAPPPIPYSMITAIDPAPGFALSDTAGQLIGPLADGEIVLNAWAARDVAAAIGDTIRVAYFEPETAHGQAVERTAEFQLKAVAGLTEPVRPYRDRQPAQFDRPLTPATDPDFTPEVKGVTDQETIDNWDAPFPFEYSRVRKVDEAYWDNYRTTPKAFVSYASGVRLWGSRFGRLTSLRVPGSVAREDLAGRLTTALASHARELGFDFTPIRQRQLEASRGTTPFDVLFLSLSLFVIAAALMLVALLFRLGVEQRGREMGTLLAVGLRRRQVRWLLVAEGTVVAAVGALVGIAVGIGYARLMLYGLGHWWLGAISTPFLKFHATPLSLILGYVLGVLVSAGTIAWTVRQTRHLPVRRLLGGQAGDDRYHPPARWQLVLAAALLVLAVALSALAMRLGGMAQAGAFVAGGAALLSGLLLWIRVRLRSETIADPSSWRRGGVLWRLATRSAARNPGRSVITIGLMATATFLIVAMSSFRLAPTEAGVGGFDLVAESAQPIFVDLNAPERRKEMFGSRAGELDGTTLLALRLRTGDDASCNNLYQATQPRVLGVTPQFIQHFDRPGVSFPWSASLAGTAEERANPWRILPGSPGDPSAPVLAVLDKYSALYSLHLYGGVGEEFEFDYDGRPIRFRVAGLLENSLLQGSLLIGEADFRARFPQVSGYRYFLVDAPPQRMAAVTELLEDQLSDPGFDAVPAADVLAQLLAVQNTYLSTFQSLGALGLLFGTFGLATVQLRSVLERRGELALLRATGYRRRRLAQLVLLENIVLLLAGLATGVVAAMLAVLPHKLLGEAAVSWTLLRDLAVMLAAVFVVGLLSSLISVRAVLRLPLLASLRGE
jgi:ABC-type antimicrobial peptide transport system permease subunit